jgi:hypothetical protein
MAPLSILANEKSGIDFTCATDHDTNDVKNITNNADNLFIIDFWYNTMHNNEFSFAIRKNIFLKYKDLRDI